MMETAPHWSYSSLNTYLQCPMKYAFRYIERAGFRENRREWEKEAGSEVFTSNPAQILVHPEGLEPATFWSVARRSIQLSYGCLTFYNIAASSGFFKRTFAEIRPKIQKILNASRTGTGAALRADRTFCAL